MSSKSISRTVYPLSYNKNATPKQRTKEFNNWAVYIRTENMDNGVIKQVEQILSK